MNGHTIEDIQKILEDFKGAIEDFNKAIELDPEDEWAYANRGYSKKFKDFKGAIKILIRRLN